MFERYSFVAITTTDLARARAFWVETLGFPVTEEEAGRFVIVDAGGLRLCIDVPDGEVHAAGGTDPTVGLKVTALAPVLEELRGRGLEPEEIGKTYAMFRDPDGRAVIVTETD